jgi:EmrB/QacA subfamily drug resistance transporter
VPTSTTVRSAGATVLLLLASAQFLMTLDTSVMNVSIAQVSSDLGTDAVGIQTAITLYTLVMAAFMLTGGKIGARVGRRRAFSIGLVVYAAGSLTTSLAPNLAVLLIGWSFLEGIGAALILPSIVALVAGNFERARRPAAYGMVAAAGAIAVTVGPILGGAVTTYGSWRYVFAGEVVVAAAILLFGRRIEDPPPEATGRFDLLGAVLSAVALASIVLGVLQSSTWGWVRPKSGGVSVLGLSPVILLVALGLGLLVLFRRHELRLAEAGGEPLVTPGLARVPQVGAGLLGFSCQFFVQAALFFVVPVYLSIVCGLSAFETGLRLVPLSVGLLLTATLIPRLAPKASPRLVAQLGFTATLVGTLWFIAGLDPKSGPEIVAMPMLIFGLGIGALASQLGAVTVSGAADEQAGEVGGLQNTMTNLGASLGTALAGAILFSALASGLVAGVNDSAALPPEVQQQATVQISKGVSIVSDAQLQQALSQTSLTPEQQAAIVDVNDTARAHAIEASLIGLAIVEAGAILLMRRLPRRSVAEPTAASA